MLIDFTSSFLLLILYASIFERKALLTKVKELKKKLKKYNKKIDRTISLQLYAAHLSRKHKRRYVSSICSETLLCVLYLRQ